MNAGANALVTPWLLFLHADVRVPPGSIRSLERWLRGAKKSEFATFAFALEGNLWFWRFIEAGQRVRERLTGLAYGDQGLLVPRRLFRSVGGFPDTPIMEDVEILRVLKRAGTWKKIPAPIVSSPRRYREEGMWRAWLRNAVLILLFKMGMAPRKLKAFYRPRLVGAEESQGPSSDLGPKTGGERAMAPRREVIRGRRLLIFAKQPVPGRVKTRLATALGSQEAARIYRRLGRTVVDQVREGLFHTVVYFDPPTAEDDVAGWLGPEGLDFRPQAPGNLGDRLEAAFREALGEAKSAVVVGTDAPSVDSDVVERAFHLLQEVDVVIGPAADGGYYLLGLNSPSPELFRGIPWSTDRVFSATLGRARTLGLEVAVLVPEQDVDTLEDYLRVMKESPATASLRPNSLGPASRP
jgi:rSAM/selenodomain-associated transferase 1